MTNLRDFHDRLGARYAPLGGRDVVLSYGDPTHEMVQARAGCGLVDRSARGKIRLTGADRISFLQAMLSNDVKRLSPGSGCYAMALTAKGKVVSDCRVLVDSQDVRLDVEPERAAAMVEFLSTHVISEDVEVTDISAELALLGVYGPRSHEAVRQILGVTIPDHENAHVHASAGGVEVHLVAASPTGDPGVDLMVPFADAGGFAQRLMDSGRSFGMSPVGFEALEVLRIEAGVPRCGPDMDEDTIPLEAGITERAVSFDKGCYIGQEVIARASHRGHVNRKLFRLAFDGEAPPPPKTELFDAADRSHAVGYVTSAVRSPTKGLIGLGYVRLEKAGAGLVTATGKAVRVN